MGATVSRLVRLIRAGRHTATAVRKVVWLLPYLQQQERRAEIAQWSQGALDIFALARTCPEPKTPTQGPCLYIANHVSWVDVLAVWASLDTQFVAKTEVGAWPVFGFLARRLGVIFIDRSKRSEARDAVKIIARALQEGRSVCVFPEGTSTDGTGLRPFHPALFQAAIEAKVPVQPLAIRYLRPDHTRAQEAAFVGEATLIQSMWQLAGASALTVEITRLPSIDSQIHDRRALARLAERQISGHLSLAVSEAPVEKANAAENAAAEPTLLAAATSS
jgi:1-acyl-sn-glycerol-3-phosphate acyltransferase